MSQVTTGAENPAEQYERYWVPVVHGPFAADLVERVQPRPGERVLDVACGTGVVARTIARRLAGNGSISGLDINPMMLDVARNTAADEGHAIDWREGSAEALPFDDASFDLVVLQQALQLVPDKAAAVAEMFRVLVPGGRVAVSAWTTIERNPVDQIVAEAFDRHIGARILDVLFSLGEPETFASLFAAAGFEDIDVQPVSIPARYPSAAEYVELIVVGVVAAVPSLRDLPEDEQSRLSSAIQADISSRLEPFIEDGALVVRSESGVLTARKSA